MTERELIIKALDAIREALINIRNGRSDRNHGWEGDINECIIDLEKLSEEVEDDQG